MGPSYYPLKLALLGCELHFFGLPGLKDTAIAASKSLGGPQPLCLSSLPPWSSCTVLDLTFRRPAVITMP